MQTVPLPHISIPHPHHLSSSLFHALEYASLVLGALGGALSTRRDRNYRFDFIGILGLGLISGVGGGIARDVLIGDGPPLALQNPTYLALALFGAGLGLFFGRVVGPRTELVLLIVDAAGLGLFTVAGASRGLTYGLGFLPCLLLGVMTAVGGGSLRDLLSGRTPRIFFAGELYTVVSVITAAFYLFLVRANVPSNSAAPTATTLGFVLRLLALRYGWRTREVDSLP